MAPLIKLREAIANVLLGEVKAYDLAEVCSGLGLPNDGGDPWYSKRVYVLGKLQNLDVDTLLEVAEKVIGEYGHEEHLRPIMQQYALGGVEGEAKNLIFAAHGPKPEIVLADAVNNRIEVVANGEYCLIFDWPIPRNGLMWRDLVAWWQHRFLPAGGEDIEVERNLYKRLASSLGSEPEKIVFETYFATIRPIFKDKNPPALVPQVYLHYDPYTIKQLGGQGRLKRQRMDFLLLLPNRQRVVIEIDGKQHYSRDGKADPALYAEMVSEDRQLRLLGYEVYRFGGSEFAFEAGRDVVNAFFIQLFQRHGLLS